jgi:hypothetical protein
MSFCAPRKERNPTYFGIDCAGEVSTGAAGAGSTAGATCTPSITLEGAAGLLLARKLSPRLVMKNTVASTAVVRLRKFAEPGRTEQTARGSATKSSPHVGPLAVLHKNQPDHTEPDQNMDRQHERKQIITHHKP